MMNKKAPTNWVSEKRKALFEKEQKFGIPKEVQELTEKHRLQAVKVQNFFNSL